MLTAEETKFWGDFIFPLVLYRFVITQNFLKYQNALAYKEAG